VSNCSPLSFIRGFDIVSKKKTSSHFKITFQKSDMKHLPYWAPTDIKHNPIKLSRQCDRAPGNCAPVPFNMAQRYQRFGGKFCQLLLGRKVSSFIRHSRLFWKFTQNKYISVAENTGCLFCRLP
jgi:hypothetical protein